MDYKRIVFIDYLKVIGLLCIILAHVCSNPYIFQIRNFDVPLMVIVSGFLALNSFERSFKKNNSYLAYYWKRIKRLVFPTWVFLIVYFAIFYLVSQIGAIDYPYDSMAIIRSFLLLDGMGYVWIVRVYLICAFLTPLIYYCNDKIKSGMVKLLILLLIYILYELFVYLGFNELNLVFEFIIAYAIPYGIIYILGMLSNRKDYKSDLKISGLFLLIFIISAICVCQIYGGFQPTQLMKYPPTIYYISYALFASFLLLGIFKRIDLKNNSIIEFCSRSSLWIYLWHILFLKLIPVFFEQINWIVFYILILACAVGVTYVQNRILDLLESKNHNVSFLNVFRG